MTIEEKLNDFIERISSNTDKLNKKIWMNDFEIFAHKHLKDHSLYSKIKTALFHEEYEDLCAMVVSISKDSMFLNKINGVIVPEYQAKTLPMYDVFISHANADKATYVDELKISLDKLKVRIFYDKDTIEWGDNWKNKILEGVKKAEFAIIVISENFFDREWTEKELNDFLNRQNRNGQKIILPILHGITTIQLKEKYPSVADIQALDSTKYSCDEIALMFAAQLIKRLKM